MPWPKNRPRCLRCDGHRDDVGTISARGLCQACGLTAMEAELEQLVARSGPYFEHWRRQVAASVGGILLDDA